MSNAILKSASLLTLVMPLLMPVSSYATGSVGATGPQGPKGDKGIQGPQGIQGKQGPIGKIGATGPKGDKGPQGAQGIQGKQGSKGPTGPAGASKGPQGSKGDTGAQGLVGATGPQGIKGDTGPTGPQGPIGLTGANGAQGTQGPIGLLGAQGLKGDKGDIGLQGPIGLTGSQGIQGQKGDTGTLGLKGDKGDTGPVGLPQAGNNIGDMQYWDGNQWQIVPPPNPLPTAPAKATLSFCMGLPSWDKDCVPPNTTVFNIGDKGPAGGIVFYLSDNSGIHGLEAAPVDQNPPTWGCIGYSISGAQATAVGAGPTNTSAIVNTGCSDSNTAAATIADTYSLNGYTDWYLPSKDELYLLYTFRENNPAVGGLITGLYWSSSEVDAGNAFAVSLGNGSQYSTGKDSNAQIRPVRSF